MLDESFSYIILAGLLAISLALFQYIYKSKLDNRLKYSLFAIRAIALFCICMLLFNPKFESEIIYNEKANLVIALDNSASIGYLNQDSNAIDIVSRLKANKGLNEKFNLQIYTFGKDLIEDDSLNFRDPQTNITKALNKIGQAQLNNIAPIVLLSDGNQTLGQDYSYSAKSIKQPIYPVVLGDSVQYEDLSIKLLNVNRYAFLRNKFPVEAILNYSGGNTVSTEFKIQSGNQTLYKTNLTFSPNNTSEIITTNLLADKVGVLSLTAELTAIDGEKNSVNNLKSFGVEVIDQKTNIALISDINHPDLGALKKSIESNEQRKVTILTPEDYLAQDNIFQLVIIYQPNNNFKKALEEIKAQNLNTFVITGENTDLLFLNNTHLEVLATVTNQTEEFQPILNVNYGPFIIDKLTFEDYPPLKSEFGGIEILAPSDVILYRSVNGINTGDAMLATYEFNNMKHALLLGEGIWRWRAQTYLNDTSFEPFDTFINKLVQYLSSNKRRNRLQIDYKSFYQGNEELVISAQYFNKSFEFDPEAALTLELKPVAEAQVMRQFPLLLFNGNYRIDLSGINPGKYNFTIKHNAEAIAASGYFEVLEYNVEQQFLNADINKLQRLAEDSKGQLYYKDEIADLINNLLGDQRYRIVQKSSKNIVPLIDWKYLLGIIALCLFSEWFIRKYHGLI